MQNIQITITIPEEISEGVINAQKRINAHEEADEYATYAVIADWLSHQENLDLEYEITEAILEHFGFEKGGH